MKQTRCLLSLHVQALLNSPLTISNMDSYLIDVNIPAKAMLLITVPLANVVRPIILRQYNKFQTVVDLPQ